MIPVLKNSWALFLGMFMLMVGNGLQGSLLGVRGDLEDFSTFGMSIVMSGYFAGFLFGSRMTPGLIRSVGHVRVFAALGSTVSAVLILYPVLVELWAWTIGRVIIGFCFSGVYVTAESWLNNQANNETRGKALSVYMIVQMSGIILAQYLLSVGDVSGYVLFIVPSVLVSLSFAPILLSVAPTPAFDTTAPMNVRQLVQTSPLASVGMFLLGGVYAAQFGMVAVFAAQIGLSVDRISLLIGAIYLAALLAQYPIGWASDRMDRRVLIVGIAALGGIGAVIAFLLGSNFWLLVAGAAMVGATTNPLYALLLAYANDFLDHDQMPAASAGFLFLNGVGAVGGPVMIGAVMGWFGPFAFWFVVAILLMALTAYGGLRMIQRPSDWTSDEDLTSYVPVVASASPVAVELAQEVYIETEVEAEAEAAVEPQGDAADGQQIS